MNDKPSTTDRAIEKCEETITNYKRDARLVFILLYAVTLVFLALISLPLIRKYANVADNTKDIKSPTNIFINKLDSMKNVSPGQFDSIVSKAASFQKLIITEEKKPASFTKSSESSKDINSLILYGVFVLIFGVLSSFYRYYLKEISRLEHFLLGFHRIRIAAVNSTAKYDGDVTTALTKDAFNFHQQAPGNNTKKVESPIPGHPSSDAASVVLNKILSQFELSFKAKPLKNGNED